MTRRLLNILAFLSLALCVLCVVGQLARCTAGPVTARAKPLVVVGLDLGKAVVGWWPPVPSRRAWAGQVNRYGFRYTRWSDGAAEVDVPLWAVAAAFAAVALLTVAAGAGPRRRPADGHCVTCGYDLRETPGRCPECGAPAPEGRFRHEATKDTKRFSQSIDRTAKQCD